MSLTPEAPDVVRLDDYVKGDLSKDTNWWGAFVVGLAGTILVAAFAPVAVLGLGSAAIPNFFFWAVSGWGVWLIIAELAAMLPDRTGGAPAYAYYAFKDRLPRAYPHINGVTVWMYWLGWVAGVGGDKILTRAYIPPHLWG